jgi:hypothetical protein
MRKPLIPAALVAAVLAMVACPEWFTDTKCEREDDCGGTLHCDLTQKRCVSTVPGPSDTGGVPADVGGAVPDTGAGGSDGGGAVPDGGDLVADGGGVAPDGGMAAADVGPGAPDGSPCVPEVDAGAGADANLLPPQISAYCTDDGGCWGSGTVTGADTVNLNAVWGDGPASVWAVGNSATIRHWNGSTWETVSSNLPPTTRFRAVGGAGSSVWIAGEAGALARRAAGDAKFAAVPQVLTTKDYLAGWTSPDGLETWFVGKGGARARCDVCTCTEMDSPAAAGTDFTSLHGLSSTDLWFARADKFLVHRAGSGAESVQTSQGSHLPSAIFTTGSTLYVGVSDYYKIQQYVISGTDTLGDYTEYPDDSMTSGVTAICGSAAPFELLAIVGASATPGARYFYVTNLTGERTYYTSGFLGSFNAAWCFGEGRFVVVGDNGKIVVHWK